MKTLFIHHTAYYILPQSNVESLDWHGTTVSPSCKWNVLLKKIAAVEGLKFVCLDKFAGHLVFLLHSLP